VSGPPSSLLLVHGAGSGPWVFAGWDVHFSGLSVHAVDLHDGLDLAQASMDDYGDRVVAAAGELAQPVSLCGWSMGGLVALMAAGRVRPHSVILIEASPPAEAQGLALETDVRSGTFDPEEVYGRFPLGIRARPDSTRARGERKRGISVPKLPCASLVVYGDEFADERGRRLARLYASGERHFPGLDHWGLVLDPQVRRSIASFLGVAQAAGQRQAARLRPPRRLPC
jgi:pimeloyl-ACP methyl ester carboxylesterase